MRRRTRQGENEHFEQTDNRLQLRVNRGASLSRQQSLWSAVNLPDDISASFPYLNTRLEDTIYDHENAILIGFYNRRRYAFRPHEIQVGMVTDPSEASSIVEEVVGLVNRTWRERERITPSFRERKLPTVYDIYKLLPGTNCKECGYPTCLACAADIRNGVISLDGCPLLSKSEYQQNKEKIYALFSSC